MALKIGINGFGRIGKTFLRSILYDDQAKKNLSITAINVGPNTTPHLAHYFKYDTLMGPLADACSYENNMLTIGEHRIPIISEADPRALAWDNYGVEWVVESSGRFTTKELAEYHLQAGAKKVLITAPSQDADCTVIPGVNDDTYDPALHHIVSLGSCTTNCYAPIVKIIDESYDIDYGMMTTIHAYTNDQVLLDIEHHDPRRGRAAAMNIIPTKTGAAKTIFQLFPHLDDQLTAHAIRVPIPKVSLLEFTFATSQNLYSADELNTVCKKYAQEHLVGIVDYTQAPLVSSDFSNNPHSAIIAGDLTQVAENMGKIVAWYDNEFGYSCRLKDFLLNQQS